MGLLYLCDGEPERWVRDRCRRGRLGAVNKDNCASRVERRPYGIEYVFAYVLYASVRADERAYITERMVKVGALASLPEPYDEETAMPTAPSSSSTYGMSWRAPRKRQGSTG